MQRSQSPKLLWLIFIGGIGGLIVTCGMVGLILVAVVMFNASAKGVTSGQPVPDVTLAPTAAVPPTAAAGATGKIAFVSDRDGNPEIYVMDADGGNQTRLTNNSERINDGYPAWSPDGKKIVFVSNRDGNTEIYVMNADGSAQTRLTNNETGDYYPDWSPDGQQIAFVSNRDGKYEICVMQADGSAQTCLSDSQTGTNATDSGTEMDGDSVWMGLDPTGVSWSPNGQEIAYSSRRSGSSKIYVMKADGSAQRYLTNDWGDSDPDWSADGQQIAFVSDREGPTGIYVMNADGSAPTRLTSDDELVALSPTWSANGQQIAFASNQDGNYEIYVMNADGSQPTRLTNNQAQDWNPAWSP